MIGWHVDDETLRRYVERTDSVAEGASVEQHVLTSASAGPGSTPRLLRSPPSPSISLRCGTARVTPSRYHARPCSSGC